MTASNRHTRKNGASLLEDGLYGLVGKIGNSIQLAGIKPVKHGFREGFGYRASDVEALVIGYNWATNTEQALMNIVEELKGQYEEAKKLWDGYDVQLTKFRSAIKNDVSSIQASASKTSEAVQRMNKAYGDVIKQMTGPEMEKAIQNAERLATAMQALANLQPHKLTLAVVDQTQQQSTAQ